ncbi:MAG: hypothetical protein U0N43_03410 [Mediterraneibacter sp.]
MARRYNSDELSRLGRQVKRALTARKRQERIDSLPEAPVMLSLCELAKKTGLSYPFIRKMVLEEGLVPYVHVGRKYCVNYNCFLRVLNGKEA